ncbi:unnamed protein product [Amoebophrya sp. A25]|nr:unnamed protein product [Amoebophrya sp. A25]|eukprot:GSA25T00004714001.1
MIIIICFMLLFMIVPKMQSSDEAWMSDVVEKFPVVIHSTKLVVDSCAYRFCKRAYSFVSSAHACGVFSLRSAVTKIMRFVFLARRIWVYYIYSESAMDYEQRASDVREPTVTGKQKVANSD